MITIPYEDSNKMDGFNQYSLIIDGFVKPFAPMVTVPLILSHKNIKMKSFFLSNEAQRQIEFLQCAYVEATWSIQTAFSSTLNPT